MRKNKIGAFMINCSVLLIGLGMAHTTTAQDVSTHYPKMAPIDQYLMGDRQA